MAMQIKLIVVVVVVVVVVDNILSPVRTGFLDFFQLHLAAI